MSTRALPRNEKAIAVAQDVLAHLPEMMPTRRTYINGSIDARDDADENKDDLQKYVDVATKECEVCALGACMLSYARLYDNVPMRDIAAFSGDGWDVSADREEIVETMCEVFSGAQLALIESAFERTAMGSIEASAHALCAAVDFGREHVNMVGLASPQDTNTAVLRGIMENIIANDGYFVPTSPTQGAKHDERTAPA